MQVKSSQTQASAPEAESSIFDTYMKEVEKRAKQFAIRLSDRPAFVFVHDACTADTRRITEEAIKHIRMAAKRESFPDWMELAGSDHMAIARGIHMAGRHIGFMVAKWEPCEKPAEVTDAFKQEGEQWLRKTEEFQGEKWSVRQFLCMARYDAQAFTALWSELNDKMGVGATSEDVDYFQGKGSGASEESMGAPSTSGGEGLESAS